MDVFEALRNRHTCREFKPAPVLKGVLLEILDAANRSPSWANTQPWEIFVAGGETLERIRKGYLDQFDRGLPLQPDFPAPTEWPKALRQRMEELISLHTREAMGPGDAGGSRAHLAQNLNFFGAPVVVYLCMDRSLGPWSLFDLGLFTQSLLLAAEEKGLDAAPAYLLVGHPEIVREEMGIPSELSVVFGIALGYGVEKAGLPPAHSPRRYIREVARFKGFGGATP